MDQGVSPSTSVAGLESEWSEPSIPERFEKIVGNYPERLAVKTRRRAFNYSELNRAANRIARAILDRMGPGSEPVAMLFEQGIDVMAALLGVLKAGKFYAAIDPSFPAERVKYILTDLQAKLIVTNSRNINLARSEAGDGCTVLNIDEIDGRLAGDNLDLRVAAGALALIGYTSGSTGVPKGVVATHRVVAQTTRAAAERKRIRVDDRLTLLHSLAFGSGHGHLYIGLLNGASVFPFDVKVEGVEPLGQWLCEERITAYHSSPSLFCQVAESLAERDKLPDLRLVHLSGAPVTRSDFELYKKHFGPQTLLEFGMGSTEARGICSAIVDRTFTYPEEGTPIGYPRLHNKVLLLDENGREVAPGQIGEIAVKGSNLSSGYWNQPDRTESKFQPLGSDERLFLTGDLGRMRADGFLIHLGRKDLMVKIRGYRVELSEIENALLAHPQVKDAGVAAWGQETGQEYLAGYIVIRGPGVPTVNELRQFLSIRLPNYMVPSVFMFLESLPMTNGKLDRKSLPRPNRRRPDLEQPYVGPSNEIETRLAQIWEALLDIRPIGAHDDFFELGGHSLTAARVVSRVVESFQLELPLHAFFESPTIYAMALIIAQSQAQPATDVRLAKMLSEIEVMTEEEARTQLTAVSGRS
jgi:amino acid adenylation domain-containing protein